MIQGSDKAVAKRLLQLFSLANKNRLQQRGELWAKPFVETIIMLYAQLRQKWSFALFPKRSFRSSTMRIRFQTDFNSWWIMKAVVKLGLLFIFQLIRAGDISKLIKDCGRFFYFALKGEQRWKKKLIRNIFHYCRFWRGRNPKHQHGRLWWVIGLLSSTQRFDSQRQDDFQIQVSSGFFTM